MLNYNMNSPIVAPPLAGAILGSPGSDFVIAEWQDPGGHGDEPFLIAPVHVHRDDDEAWYVLHGTLRVRVGDEIVEASAGSAVLVPRGTPHTYWNPGAGPCRYLLVMTTRIHALIQALHQTTDRSPDGIRSLFENHDSEFLGW